MYGMMCDMCDINRDMCDIGPSGPVRHRDRHPVIRWQEPDAPSDIRPTGPSPVPDDMGMMGEPTDDMVVRSTIHRLSGGKGSVTFDEPVDHLSDTMSEVRIPDGSGRSSGKPYRCDIPTSEELPLGPVGGTVRDQVIVVQGPEPGSGHHGSTWGVNLETSTDRASCTFNGRLEVR